jgi:hypothetical protein
MASTASQAASPGLCDFGERCRDSVELCGRVPEPLSISATSRDLPYARALFATRGSLRNAFTRSFATAAAFAARLRQPEERLVPDVARQRRSCASKPCTSSPAIRFRADLINH